MACFLTMHVINERGNDIKWVFAFACDTRSWRRTRRYPVIGLGESKGLFKTLLRLTHHRRTSPHIERIRTFDLLIRTVFEAVQDHRAPLGPKLQTALLQLTLAAQTVRRSGTTT